MAEDGKILEAYVEIGARTAGADAAIDGMKGKVETALGNIQGPAIKPRFDFNEQQIRDGMAKAMRSMRDQAQKMNIAEAVKERLFGSPEKAPEEAEAVKKVAVAAKSAKEEATGLRKALLEARAEFGRGSTAGMFAQLARGAGPALAIGIGLHFLADMAESVSKIDTEIRKSQTDWMATTVEIGKSVPLLGSVVSIGQAIREMWRGDALSLEQINADISEGNRLLEIRQAILEQHHEQQVAIASSQQAATNALRSSQAVTPGQKSAASIANEEANRQLKLQQDKEAFQLKERAGLKAQTDVISAAAFDTQQRAGPGIMEHIAGIIDRALGGGNQSEDFFAKRASNAGAQARGGITVANRKAAAAIEENNSALEKIAAEEKKAAIELWRSSIKSEVADLNQQAANIGLNPLQQTKNRVAFEGKQGQGIEAATGKLLGAQLTESVKTPFQEFQKNLGYWRQLLTAGDINQNTFIRLQSKAFESIQSTFSRSDIDTAARSRLAQQFSLGLMMPAVNRMTGGSSHAEVHRSTDNNTGALQQLTAAIRSLIGNPQLSGARYR